MTVEAQQMIEYVSRIIRKRDVQIDENTALISTGLVDSMGALDLLVKLEDLTNTRIPPAKVQPKDIDTVALMFATVQRVGRPRK